MTQTLAISCSKHATAADKREPPAPWGAGGGGGSVSNLAVRHWTITAGLSTRPGTFVLSVSKKQHRRETLGPPLYHLLVAHTPGLYSRISVAGGAHGSALRREHFKAAATAALFIS